jgi:hypothetical protein
MILNGTTADKNGAGPQPVEASAAPAPPSIPGSTEHSAREDCGE